MGASTSVSTCECLHPCVSVRVHTSAFVSVQTIKSPDMSRHKWISASGRVFCSRTFRMYYIYIVDWMYRIATDIGGVFNFVHVDSQGYSQIHYYYCSTSPHSCNFVGRVSFSTQTVERVPCLPCCGPFTTVIDQRCEACNVNLEVRAWEYSDRV